MTDMPVLQFQAELTPRPFAETGRPAGGFQRDDGQVIALCSDFDLLYWPGRAIYDGQRLRHRISLYSRGFERLLGVFDEAHFPVNDIAFHPTQPIIAVGTGSYDGGYMFEGDLWLWNWETGEVRNLLGESREVVQCRFVDSSRLAVTLRPRFEDEFGGEENEALETCVGLILDDLRDAIEAGFKLPQGEGDPRLVDLVPLDPGSLGFSTPPMHFKERRQRFDAALGGSANYEERARAWDVRWITAERIALVHDNCHIEVWNVNGEREVQVTGEGFGVQILGGPNGPLVHVVRRANYSETTDDRSTLFRLVSSGLEQVHEFDGAVVISMDDKGNLLCRDPGDWQRKRGRMDQVLTSELNQVFAGDLGHYDCFNHFMRLDGGDGLYFLQGTPPSSHEHKRLCRFNSDGSVSPVFKWDDAKSHLMNGSACWGPNGSLLRSFSVYDPCPGQSSKKIQRCNVATGRALWTTEVSALVTSMAIIGEEFLAYALTDGEIGLLSIEDGSVLFQGAVKIGDAPSVATAIAANGSRLAIGTIDARLLLYALEF
ncbi:MAG: hypothetical protein KDB14_33855 [Planctomycetales bacterium]|nr:hypothetical protein [Planctomycetales bacterium]